MMRARSAGSSIFGSAGSMFAGSAPSFSIRSAGSSKAGSTFSVAMPSRPARLIVKRCASSVEMLRVDFLSARSARHSATSAGRLCARTAERPARQRLAGYHLPWPKMNEAARRELSRGGGSTDRRRRAWSARTRRVPLGGLAVVDRDEGRLAAHRQADVLRARDRRRPARRARRSRSRRSENG